MKIINKSEMIKLMEDYPNGGIVFAEYEPDVLRSSLMVTDGDFGATDVIPYHAEVFDWDWSIKEYNERDLFVVYDRNDILQMIQTLTKNISIPLVEE